MSVITSTIVGERKWDSWSTAPNGSAHCHDFYTAVTYRETWANVPDNGIYAGREYRIVETYISSSPEHRGQCIGRSSQPWKE